MATGPALAPPIPSGIQKLLEKPDESGYSVTESPTALLSCDLDGGSPRTRLDEIGGSRFVSLQWSGSKKRWQTVRDFLFQNVALNCPQFKLDLIIGTSEYQEYLCNVIPDSVQTSSPVGQYYVIKARLEVQPRDDELAAWPGAPDPESWSFLGEHSTGSGFTSAENACVAGAAAETAVFWAQFGITLTFEELATSTCMLRRSDGPLIATVNVNRDS